MKVLVATLVTLAALAGCGGADVQRPGPEAPSAAEQVRKQNQAIIGRASDAADARAADGERAIREALKRELDMQPNGDFGVTPPPRNPNVIQVGSDCYVKTGAEAINFSDQTEHMLYSPANPSDAIFVQSSTKTPLVDCLKAAKDALGW